MLVSDMLLKLQKMDPNAHVCAMPFWTAEDVIGYAKNEMDEEEVTLEEANNILDDMEDHCDPELGVTWLTIQNAIEEYPLSNDAENPIEIPKHFEEISPFWLMIFEALKITGTFKDALSYIEEALNKSQYDEIEHFFDWLDANELTIGHGNYWMRYSEFKKQENRDCTHPNTAKNDGVIQCQDCGSWWHENKTIESQNKGEQDDE
jgi:tetratricopeptide (TPR) repeat protein